MPPSNEWLANLAVLEAETLAAITVAHASVLERILVPRSSRCVDAWHEASDREASSQVSIIQGSYAYIGGSSAGRQYGCCIIHRLLAKFNFAEI